MANEPNTTPAADPNAKPADPNPSPPPSLLGEPPKAEDWKEYAPDPAKSEADNAAAKAEHDKGKPAEGKKLDAPVAFEADKIKLPEGFTKDDESFGKFGEIMNDSKLSPTERGQKLVELQAEVAKKASEAGTKAWNDLQDQWVRDVKADKEIGGDKLIPTQQVISKAIDALGPDSAKAFRLALDYTGAGNNPAIIKGLAAMGKLLTEGGHITGNPPKTGKTIQEEFFPNSPEMKG